MIREMLAARRLPELMRLLDGTPVTTAEQWPVRRAELLDLLSREAYGVTPPAPAAVRAEVTDRWDSFAGKAVCEKVRLSFDTPGGTFTFPVRLVAPRADAPVPVFLTLAFRAEIPNEYLPAEEIIDHGFAICNVCYADISSDSAEPDGLAAMYPRDAQHGWGKFGVWAFAASRVMDYLLTRPELDQARVAVCGHSRLGKAALWAGAQDERFAMVIANESGCSGAALSRGKTGERIRNITTMFPYWFCGRYAAWADREEDAPFDQHMLLALIAPRLLYVCSADGDKWSDPDGEFLGCCAASEAWTLLGVPGLIAPDRIPPLDEPLLDGNVCYHDRTGTHFYSRTDWGWQMRAREEKRV